MILKLSKTNRPNKFWFLYLNLKTLYTGTRPKWILWPKAFAALVSVVSVTLVSSRSSRRYKDARLVCIYAAMVVLINFWAFISSAIYHAITRFIATAVAFSCKPSSCKKSLKILWTCWSLILFIIISMTVLVSVWLRLNRAFYLIVLKWYVLKVLTKWSRFFKKSAFFIAHISRLPCLGKILLLN